MYREDPRALGGYQVILMIRFLFCFIFCTVFIFFSSLFFLFFFGLRLTTSLWEQWEFSVPSSTSSSLGDR